MPITLALRSVHIGALRHMVGFLCMSWLSVLTRSIFVSLGETGSAIANAGHWRFTAR